MKRTKEIINWIVKDESGLETAEYVVGGAVIVVLAALGYLGMKTDINKLYEKISTSMTSV